MNDKELADKVVALELDGLHGRYAHKAGNREWFTYARDMEAKEFVRDWRVAGALMEKMDGELLIWRINYEDEDLEGGELISVLTGYAWVVEPVRSKDSRQDESLPRAIIEACCEALND